MSREVLPVVRVPTVVAARAPPQRGPSEYFARRIAGAKLVELPNLRSIYHWVDDDANEIALRETRRLVNGRRQAALLTERMLATVLFTDLVGSTERAADAR